MRITRCHHIVVLHLSSSSPEAHSLVDRALPLDDEFHFHAPETGFPDHVTSYSVQTLSSPPHQLHGQTSADQWQKPSEFRRTGVEVTDRSAKENLPPQYSSPQAGSATSYLSEASVHSALRLHQILDALPSALGGQSLLTILWPYLDNDGEGGGIDLEDHVELFGALKRARDWFDARIFIHTNEVGDGLGNDAGSALWEALLDASFLPTSLFQREIVFDTRSIWTGVVGDGRERFLLSTAEEIRSTKSKEKSSKARLSAGGGKPGEGTESDTTVRLLLSHSLKLQRVLPRHKLPYHRICSERGFYLSPLTLIRDSDGDSQDNSSLLSRLFPSSSSSDCVILTLEFAIDGKPPPTNKDNGAGRRPWDKLAASTSGSTSGEGDGQCLSPREFIFNRPHPTTSLKDIRDGRCVHFVACPAMEREGTPYLKLFRLRQDAELSSSLFERSIPCQEADQKIDESFLAAIDQLPRLSSAESFAQCVKAMTKGEDYHKTLASLGKEASDDRSVPPPPSPLDILHLENDAENPGIFFNAAVLLKEGDGKEHAVPDATSANGGLLGDVAALVRADIQDDPFNRKVRAEDILLKCRKRFEELWVEATENKRRRQTSFEGANIAAISWPDVKEIQWHDVYYNRGSESEEKAQEIHLLKVSFFVPFLFSSISPLPVSYPPFSVFLFKPNLFSICLIFPRRAASRWKRT